MGGTLQLTYKWDGDGQGQEKRVQGDENKI